VTIYNSPPPSPKKNKKRKKKNNKKEKEKEQEKIKENLETKNKELNKSQYGTDSNKSIIPEENTQSELEDDGFINDDGVDINYIAMWVNIPVPSKDDFFVHQGNMESFEKCNWFKNRMNKIEKWENHAKE